LTIVMGDYTFLPMDYVNGTTDDTYAEVRDVFAKVVTEDWGAQLAVYVDGRLVADLWTAASGGPDALTESSPPPRARHTW